MPSSRLVCCLAVLVAAPLAAQSPLDRAGWLAGCWELRRGERVTVEMWMAPAGGLMLGASRTTVGTALREWEQLRISAAGDTLVYTANPSGQAQASFRTPLPAAGDTLTFENLAHDFPQRIRYVRRGADSLVARVEAGARGFDLPMRKVACG